MDGEDSGVEYNIADSIGKVLALVNQVSFSVFGVFCTS